MVYEMAGRANELLFVICYNYLITFLLFTVDLNNSDLTPVCQATS